MVAIGLACLAGDVVEGDAVDADGVPQEREERGNVEAKHGGPDFADPLET